MLRTSAQGAAAASSIVAAQKCDAKIENQMKSPRVHE